MSESIARIIRRFGLVADKRLGQHFLLDPAILARVAAAAAPFTGFTVLEVGPGPGGLTTALLAAGAERVVAVERDRRFAGPLDELAARHPGRLELVQADAMTIDPTALAGGRPLRIVANLPYNIGTELLARWLERPDGIAAMVLMFQKEVALRLAAMPGSKEYGRLTVLAQSICSVERLFDLPAGAFLPPPKVASSVVRLVPHRTMPAPPLRRALSEVTRAAFGQRRKMLRSSLSSLGQAPENLMQGIEIVPTQRAEELSIEQYRALAQRLLDLRGPDPPSGDLSP